MADESGTPAEATTEAPATEAPATETPAAPERAEFDLLGLPDDDNDFVEMPTEEAPTEEAPTEEETPPEEAAAPEGEDQTEQETPKPEAPTPQQAPKPEAAASPQAPAEQPPAPAEEKPLVEQIAENKTALIDALAADRFALSKEDEAALEMDPTSYAPKLMARAYYESMVGVLNHINGMVPTIVQNVVQAMDQQKSAETAFYEKFPAIDPSAHSNDVLQFAQMFRGQNPQISQDDLFSLVGAAVMAKYGLQQAAAQGNGGSPKPQPKPQPYVPAQSGGSVKITKEPESPFGILGMPDADEG